MTDYGQGHDRMNKNTEAEICETFERYIWGKDGDAINDYFKVGEGDILYVFNGSYYEKIDDIQLNHIIKQAMDKMNIGLIYRKNSHEKIAKECFDGLRCNPKCAFDPDRRYIVFRNCVLDTAKQKIMDYDIKYKTDLVLDFNYNPNADSRLWDKFIKATIPDTGMRYAFQQFCGAFLANRKQYKIEFICLMVGGGRNGKSVACDAISGLFGKSLVSHYSPEQLFRSSQSMYNLADINGKMANFADDVSNKDFSGGDFKQFISGAEFQARHPYGRPFVVTKVPLMVCCVNEIPPTTDDTLGHYRRLLPILCPNQISDADVDVELPNKLSTPEAKAAIFNWIYEGYKMLVKNHGKIDLSDSIKYVKEEIKEDSNSARRWIRESGFIAVEPSSSNDTRWRSMKDWMQDYMEYCKTYSEAAKSSKAVAKVFKELGFCSEKRFNTTWYCIGRKGDESWRSAIPTQSLNPVMDSILNDDNEDLPF